MGQRNVLLVGLVVASLQGCGLGLGIRGIDRPSAAERAEEQRQAEARANAAARRRRAREHCELDTGKHVREAREKHQHAKRTLKAAAERLRVAQELGDPPTIVQAMKERDEADEAVRQTWYPSDAAQKQLTESCIRDYLKSSLP